MMSTSRLTPARVSAFSSQVLLDDLALHPLHLFPERLVPDRILDKAAQEPTREIEQNNGGCEINDDDRPKEEDLSHREESDDRTKSSHNDSEENIVSAELFDSGK